MTYEDASEYLRFEDSYSLLGAILDFVPPYYVADRALSYADGLKLLGEHWTSCDNIREYLPVLKKVLGLYGPIRDMMSPEENTAYDALPQVVTCYRGCDSSFLTGASWTLDWEVANRFPFLNRYKVPSPVVVTARAKKERILALKLDRDEVEIITFSPRRIRIDPANEQRASLYSRSGACACAPECRSQDDL